MCAMVFVRGYRQLVGIGSLLPQRGFCSSNSSYRAVGKCLFPLNGLHGPAFHLIIAPASCLTNLYSHPIAFGLFVS